MAREFFCEVMGQVLGPFEAAELKRMAQSGALKPADKIREGSNGKWYEAGKVKLLFEQRPATVEPKPKPAPAPSVPVAAQPASVSDKVPRRPPKPLPLTPEVLHANDDVVASWIGPAAPPAAQPSTARDWQPSSDYIGQPGAIVPHLPPQYAPAAPYAPAAMPVSVPVGVGVESDYPCPFCSEPIKRSAKKCRHCGEFLDPTLRAAQSPARSFAQAPVTTTVNVSNVVQVGGFRQRIWSPGVAVLLSLFIPGLGQLYKGQILSGVVWFFIVSVGYLVLIVPGFLLHLCCLIGASMGDPYEQPRGI